MLEVLKLRGSNYLSGQHSYRISAAGLSVFPRLADTVDASNYDLGAERVSTGIEALDEMLTDGYWPGSSTLCAGPSGIGKTLMGLHFIVAGAVVRRAWDHREPPGKSDPAHARRAKRSAGRSMTPSR